MKLGQQWIFPLWYKPLCSINNGFSPFGTTKMFELGHPT